LSFAGMALFCSVWVFAKRHVPYAFLFLGVGVYLIATIYVTSTKYNVLTITWSTAQAIALTLFLGLAVMLGFSRHDPVSHNQALGQSTVVIGLAMFLSLLSDVLAIVVIRKVVGILATASSILRIIAVVTGLTVVALLTGVTPFVA